MLTRKGNVRELMEGTEDIQKSIEKERGRKFGITVLVTKCKSVVMLM